MQEIFKNNRELILSILKNLDLYLEKQIKTDNIEELKDVEYYSNLVNAFINNSLELDKSILSLSSGAIGVLITFKTNLNIETYQEKILYILSLLAFLSSIILIILVFEYNKKYLEKLVKNKDTSDISSKLYFLDVLIKVAFLLGILLSSILGIKLL